MIFSMSYWKIKWNGKLQKLDVVSWKIRITWKCVALDLEIDIGIGLGHVWTIISDYGSKYL